jgi:hypothetical protein
MMEIAPLIPENFKETLDEYLRTIRNKKNEYDKRSYFKSKIMEGIFKINPDYIDFEKDRVDLYFAGVLIETKNEMTPSKIANGLDEIQRYLQKRKNTVRAVITDGLLFYIYNDPEKIKDSKADLKPDFIFEIGSLLANREMYSTAFNNLYSTLYPSSNFKLLEEDVIVPRIVNLIDKLAKDIKNINSTRHSAWKSYISIVFGNSDEASDETYKKQALLYYFVVFLTSKIMQIKTTRKNILNGLDFVSSGIMNFIDTDNFFDFLNEDDKILGEIEAELDLYDFTSNSTVSEEVFRLLYEEIVSPSQRHDLGEFYTPAWLANILVENAIKTGNEVVLDPACGSGTFIRLSLRKIKDMGNSGSVIGFDINPIAVQIARVNYILEDRNVLIIPIFLADSLMPNLVTFGTSQGKLER